MIQLNKSQATNSNAVYPDNPLTASYTGDIVVELTQSYDQSATIAKGVLINSPGPNVPALVFQIEGDEVPSPSGQYIANLYTGNVSDMLCGQADVEWDLTNAKWSDPRAALTDYFLSQERAYVSGSNEEDITQYVSSNENGTYTTYNG